jgi:type II secretory pathway component PulJ
MEQTVKVACLGLSADPPRGWRAREGFSLLEVAVTVCLVTSLALAVALLLVPVARQARANAEVVALNLAVKSLLERIQATPFRELRERFPPGRRIELPQLPAAGATVRYGESRAHALVIRVEVDWQGPELGSMRQTLHAVRTEEW